MMAISTPPKILIVEDDGIIAMCTKVTLLNMGYDVLPIALCDTSALSITREHKPDLVLMDILIHGEKDGIAVAGEIQRQLCIPIIYYSVSSDEETRERALKVPNSVFLNKLASNNKLNQIINNALSTFSNT